MQGVFNQDIVKHQWSSFFFFFFFFFFAFPSYISGVHPLLGKIFAYLTVF